MLFPYLSYALGLEEGHALTFGLLCSVTQGGTVHVLVRTPARQDPCHPGTPIPGKGLNAGSLF